MEKMDVWHIRKDFNQESVNNWDLRLKMFQDIFRVHLFEFFSHTKKSFRNLIREDEQKQMESSIWKQIDDGNENDYIYFHMRKSDGSYISVLDHGRIVETPQYGRAFYVMFIDWEDKK